MKFWLNNEQSKSLFVCIVGLIFCWGIVLRFFEIGVPSFWMDEAFSVEIGQALRRGDIQLSQFLGVGHESYRGLLYHGYLAVIFDWAGETEATARFASAIIGTLLVIVCTLFTYRAFNRHAAGIVAILMSLGYWQIAWSRQAREYIVVSLFIWLGVLLINRFWPLRHKLLLKLSILLGLSSVAIGIHLFGLVILSAAYFRIVASGFFSSSKVHQILAGLGCLLGLSIPILALRTIFSTAPLNFDLYVGYLWQSYWPLLLLSLGLVFTPDNKQREHVIWLLMVFAFILVIFSAGLPKFSMRYTFVIAPLISILAAVGLANLRQATAIYGLLWLASAIVLFTAETIVIKPRGYYELESYIDAGNMHFYTPQPRFREAYTYINQHLGEVDLITPYPAVSRRYRRIDDIMALNIGIPFGIGMHSSKNVTEPYTGLYYATSTAISQLSSQLGEVYLLVDRMAFKRLNPSFKLLIAEHGRKLKTWERPPVSNLYLYRIAPP